MQTDVQGWMIPPFTLTSQVLTFEFSLQSNHSHPELATLSPGTLREEYSELLVPSCRSRRVPAGGSPPSGCRHSAAPGRQGGGRRRGRAPAGAALERAAAELRGSCARSRAPAAGRAPPSGDPQACR